MNIFFLTRSLDYGGSERQLVLLAKGLCDRKINVTVATFYPDGAFSKELERDGIPVESLGKRGRWQFVGFFRRLVKLVCRVQPTIVHGYLATANILSVLLKPFCPSSKIVWGIRASNMELQRYGRIDQIQSWIEAKLARFADLIVVNSYAGYAYATHHGFPQQKMVVIPNGIDVDRYRPDYALRTKLRGAWGVSDRNQVIGLVARLDPMKGHETFIAAAALLAKKIDEIKFVCVGNGPESFRRRLVDLSEAYGLGSRLIWMGASDDVQSIYNALDLLTSCSIYGEGFSNVIGEAMACGRHCVVTNVGDAKRIIGSTGYVVPPGDPRALADAWLEALEANGEEKIRRNQLARERIIEHFSLQRLIEESARRFSAIA